MEEQRVLIADNTINWKSILLVERQKTESGDYAFTVHFADEKSATFHQNSPEGSVLLNHWQRFEPKVPAGAERIPIR